MKFKLELKKRRRESNALDTFLKANFKKGIKTRELFKKVWRLDKLVGICLFKKMNKTGKEKLPKLNLFSNIESNIWI